MSDPTVSEPTVDHPLGYGHDGQTVAALFAPPQLALVPPPEPQAEPRRTWTARSTVAALVTAACVFTATAGTFGALYLVAGGDQASAAQSLAEQHSELAALSDQLVSAESDRQRAQQRNSALAAENTGLSACVNAVQHRLWDNLSDAQQLDAVRVIFADCQ